MNGNLYPKNNKSLEVYRGDTLKIIFDNISDIDTGIVTIQFQVRLEPESTLLINKNVLSSDDGNDWVNEIVAVNLTPGQTQGITPDTLYRYDLRITRDGIVNADYFGNFYLVGDISGTGTIVDPVSEADIYANLASIATGLGASLIGVLGTFWTSILGGGNETVEKAIEWLYDNKLFKSGSFSDNKIIRSDGTNGTGQTSGVTIDDSNNVTGINDLSITGNAIVTGNLTVSGTTTTIDTQNLTVEDKNIIIGNVSVPTDIVADGGGITLKGTIDKTLNWVDSTDSWTSSENLDLASGKVYKIDGVQIDTDDIIEGSNLYFTTSRARVAAVADTIVDGITDIAPSQNAVYDALALAVSNPMTTDGDLIYQNAGDPDRLPIGTSGQILSVSSGYPAWETRITQTITNGVQTTAPSEDAVFDALALKLTDPLTTNGDIMIRAAGVSTRLPIGTSGQILTVVSGLPDWEDLGSFTSIDLPDGSAANPSLQIGDEQNGLFSPGANQLGIATGGVERLRIASTGQISAVIESTVGTDYNSTLYNCYMSKFWVTFTGTGTPAITASGNVASLTDNGTGDYTLTFTNALPDTAYAIYGSVQRDTGGAVGDDPVAINISRNAGVKLGASCRVIVITDTGAVDCADVMVAGIR